MRERELEPECPVLKEENRALSIAYEDKNPNRFYEEQVSDLNYIPTIEQLGYV